MIRIAGRQVGIGQSPFIIAEMSGNHNQSLDRALEIVESAARAGAHGLKIQTYTPDTMTIDLNAGDFTISDAESPWREKSLYELYGEAYTPWEWHKPIFERASELGMTPFSTPFDESAVDFLERAGVQCYKIASFENTDLPLIRRVAATGKPVIISTGMANLAEIDETVRAARDAGCRDLILLKCTSNYPSKPENCNLITIPHMRALFGCEVGLSDHTRGIGVAVGAIALGATVIEKHFTLNRAEGGVDAAFSMEPSEFKMLVDECEQARLALGKVYYGPTEAEKASLKYRRSLYVVKDLVEGDILTKENIRNIRPGNGLAPRYYNHVLGKKIVRPARRGEPLTWDLLLRN